MANLFGRTRPLDASRTVPTGDSVGSYTSYLDAQKAVDYLADQQFPVQLVSIVGNDLKMVERVTGKLSYPRVALSGALTGAWFGLFVGVLLSVFAPASATGGGYFSIMTSILMGAAFWMLFGVATYAMQRGKRDFTSTSQVLASSYDVIVAPDHSAEARRILAQLPMSTAAARPAPYHGQQNIQQTPPQRPDGWTDPYGGPAASEPHAGPPAADPRTQAPVEGAIVPEAGPTPGSYHDLPDGRPQYGIRLPAESESAESAEQGAPEQPARQHTPHAEQPQHDA
ncbi:MAG: ECF transporter S component [Actinomycetota bacterium]|nr:ECF transporter S component [Actinomycetota bacterium]